MNKQHAKELKQQLKLPGKFNLSLENLLGQKEDLLGKFKLLVNTLKTIAYSNCLFGTIPTYTIA